MLSRQRLLFTATVDVNTVGIWNGGGLVHTPDTAFTIRAGQNGTASRLVSFGGKMMSPFLWQPSDTPPPAAGAAGPIPAVFNNADGFDLFVDTDAGVNGGENHLMVHDLGCMYVVAGDPTSGDRIGGPWRDMATGDCRM